MIRPSKEARFAWGAAVLVELAIHLRHFTNLVLFAHLRSSAGVTGKLSYRAWLSYRISAAQLVGFAGLYSVCALLGNGWFFAGGAIKCLVEAAKRRRLANRRRADDVARDWWKSSRRARGRPTPPAGTRVE